MCIKGPDRLDRVRRIGMTRKSTKGPPPLMKEDEDGATKQPHEWPNMLTNYAKNKFNSSMHDSTADQLLVQRMESWARAERLEHGCRTQGVLRFGDFLKARDKMATGKTPGGDEVPSILLALIDDTTAHQIYGAFLRRIQGIDSELIPAWHENISQGIWRNKGSAMVLKFYRWICCVCACSKWYERCLATVLWSGSMVFVLSGSAWMWHLRLPTSYAEPEVGETAMDSQSGRGLGV